MDEKQLLTYLNDHLAGSVAAIEMVETCRDENRESPLGESMGRILKELEEDQSVLKGLIDAVGGGENPAKKMSGWLAEKVNRLRMVSSDFAQLRRLEQVEILLVGIRGKLALWMVLEEISRHEQRLRGPDYPALQDRARRQMELVEREHLGAARKAFLEE